MNKSVHIPEDLPSLSDLLRVYSHAELAREMGVPRGRIHRLRHGVNCEDSLIEPLARAMHQDPDYIREIVQADRRRKAAA
ncbi:MAG TPA: hypothetical protein VHR97_14700 [Candidatus Baltobacteraceae bacterium]|jgi:plasmid maintenance system antidote protein VapI|nr:hypothetical protein [Candidatus Baltobacteraceae bacterium]